MKMLNAEMTSLLDKLYNLRGDDSVVLVSMDEERREAVETRDKTSALKAELQDKINVLTSEENVLAEEGAKLKAVLSAIKKDDFATVIEHLNIDFDPDDIRAKVEERLPETLEKVASEKKDAGEELVKVEDEMNQAITKIEELGIRRDEAISNQERLNKYFELALNSNINITRDEITSLLAKFDFTEEEQREAAKILMFPEDGLFDYEDSYAKKEETKKEVDEFAKEIRDKVAEEERKDAEVIIEPVINEELTNSHYSQTEISIPVQEQKEPTKEDVMAFFKAHDFDGLDFTANDIDKLLEHFNEELFAKNISLFNSLGISMDIFYDNVELMYDTELDEKVKRLIGVGKTAQDMYLNPSVLIKYNLVELNDAIEVLTNSGLDPKNVPLMAY